MLINPGFNQYILLIEIIAATTTLTSGITHIPLGKTITVHFKAFASGACAEQC